MGRVHHLSLTYRVLATGHEARVNQVTFPILIPCGNYAFFNFDSSRS